MNKPEKTERQQLIDLIRSRRHELDESWQIADAILEAGYRLSAELERLREMQRRAADCMATAGPGKLDQAGMLVARYILTGDAREVES